MRNNSSIISPSHLKSQFSINLRARGLLVLLLVYPTSLLQPAVAEDKPSLEKQWLERMLKAHSIGYTGTLVLQHSEAPKVAARITHGLDADGFPHTLIRLPGQAEQKIVRSHKLTAWPNPQKKTVIYFRSQAQGLPGYSPEIVDNIMRNYALTLGPIKKLADHNVQVLMVSPKDAYRYGHEYWLDTKTALPLRARLVTTDPQMQDEYTFAEISFSQRTAIFNEMATMPKDWREIQLSEEKVSGNREAPWQVVTPPGYILLHTYWIKRADSGDADKLPEPPFIRYAYSDGLSSVSLFIREARVRQPARQRHQDVYQRDLDGYRITALGDVPIKTMQALGESVQWKQP